MRSTCHLLAGRLEKALEGYLEILDRMAAPGGIGMSPTLHRYMELAITYSAALIETFGGLTNAARRVDILEKEPLFEVNAWRLRMLGALQRGDIEEAIKCKRTAESLTIRNSPSHFFEGSDIFFEAIAYVEIGDVARLRETLDQLEAIAARYRDWAVVPLFVRGYILRLRGEAASAVETFHNALSLCSAGTSSSWVVAARGYLLALAESGDMSKARVRGAIILDDARVANLTAHMGWLHHAMAAVELAGGDYDAALTQLQLTDMYRQRWPFGKVFEGACHELYARVAIAKRDQEGFVEASKQCSECFVLSRNPILITRYQRLLQDAERAGLRLPTSLSVRAAASFDGEEEVTITLEGTSVTVERKLVLTDYPTFEDRVAKVLALVAERGLGEHAMLYLLRNHEPTLVGQRGSCPETSRMDVLVTEYLRAELANYDHLVIDPGDMVTSTVDDSAWIGPSGIHFAPALLSHIAGDRVAITGVLVFDLQGIYHPHDSLLSDLSIAFTSTKDVEPLFIRQHAKSPVLTSA